MICRSVAYGNKLTRVTEVAAGVKEIRREKSFLFAFAPFSSHLAFPRADEMIAITFDPSYSLPLSSSDRLDHFTSLYTCEGTYSRRCPVLPTSGKMVQWEADVSYLLGYIHL